MAKRYLRKSARISGNSRQKSRQRTFEKLRSVESLESRRMMTAEWMWGLGEDSRIFEIGDESFPDNSYYVTTGGLANSNAPLSLGEGGKLGGPDDEVDITRTRFYAQVLYDPDLGPPSSAPPNAKILVGGSAELGKDYLAFLYYFDDFQDEWVKQSSPLSGGNGTISLPPQPDSSRSWRIEFVLLSDTEIEGTESITWTLLPDDSYEIPTHDAVPWVSDQGVDYWYTKTQIFIEDVVPDAYECECECGENGEAVNKVSPDDGSLKSLITLPGGGTLSYSQAPTSQIPIGFGAVPKFVGDLVGATGNSVSIDLVEVTIELQDSYGNWTSQKKYYNYNEALADSSVVFTHDFSSEDDVVRYRMSADYGRNNGGFESYTSYVRVFLPLSRLHPDDNWPDFGRVLTPLTPSAGLAIERPNTESGFFDGMVFEGLDKFDAATSTIRAANGNTIPLGDWRTNFATSNYSGGNYVITDRDGNIQRYDASGRIVSRESIGGLTTSYAYVGIGGGKQAISTITEPGNRVTTFGYTSGKLSSVTDNAGNVVTLTPDSNGRLGTVTQPVAYGSGTTATTFSYNGNGLITSVTDGAKQQQFAYDSTGRVSSVTTTPTGSSSSTVRNIAAQRSSTIALEGNAAGTIGAPKTLVARSSYVAEYDSWDGIEYSDATFDVSGNVISETTAAGTTTKTYDPFQNVAFSSFTATGASTPTSSTVAVTELNSDGTVTVSRYASSSVAASQQTFLGSTTYADSSMSEIVAETTPSSNLVPTMAPIQTSSSTSLNVTDQVPQASVNLPAIFSDAVDSDSVLRYSLISNTNASLFSVVDVSDADQLLMQFSGVQTGSATIVLRVTNTGGLSEDHQVVVTRTADQALPRLVSNSSLDSTRNAAAALADGGYVVAWLEAGALKARLYNSDGTARTSAISVASAYCEEFSVTGLDDGGFAVVWQDYYEGVAHAKRFNAAGGLVFSVDTITDDDMGPGVFYDRPGLSAVPGGGFAIVFRQASVENEPYSNYVFQEFDSLGQTSRLFPALPLPIEYGDDTRLELSMLSDGGFIVGGSSGTDRYRFNENGELLPTFGYHHQPYVYLSNIANAPDGSFLLGWTDAFPNVDSGVYFARYGADGTATSRVLSQSGANAVMGDITHISDGGIAIAWVDGTDIYVRRFDGSNQPLESPVLIATNVTPQPTHSAFNRVNLITLADGGLAISWLQPNVGSGSQVVQKRIPSIDASAAIPGDFRIASVGFGDVANEGNALGKVQTLYVTFSRPVDTNTFTVADLALRDPSGALIDLTSINAPHKATINRISKRQFSISFASPLETSGDYTLTIDDAIAASSVALSEEFKVIFHIADGPSSDSATAEYEHDARGRVTNSLTPDGLATSIVYSTNLVGDSDAPVGASSRSTSTANGRVTKTYFNANEQILRIVYPAVANPSNPSVTTRPVENYTYYSDGRIKTYQDAEGRETAYVYDALGRKVKVISPDPDTGEAFITNPGNPADHQYIAGLVTETVYDRYGRVRKTIDPLGRETGYAYNSFGKLWKTIAPNPQTGKAFATDLSGNDVLSSPVGLVTTSSYYANGLLRSVTDPAGSESGYVYDSAGRVIKTIAPNAVTGKAFDVDPNNSSNLNYVVGVVTQTVYGDDGNVREIIDPLNRRTAFLYDNLGRQTHAISPDPVSGLAYNFTTGTVLGSVTEYVYSATGDVTSVNDPLGRSTHFIYDVLGRQNAVIDALGNVTSQEFDVYGNTTGTTDALGRTTRYAYDANDRLDSVTMPIATVGGVPLVTSYLYDLTGLTIKETSRSASVTVQQSSYAYDEAGRLIYLYQPDPDTGLANTTEFTTYLYDDADQLVEVVDVLGRHTGYVYDKAGRRTDVILPSNSTGLAFGVGGTFVGSVTHYEFDGAGRVTRQIDPNPTTGLAINSSSQIVGTVSAFIYDGQGRLNRAIKDNTITPSPSNPYGATTRYEYDAAGQITAVAEYATLAQSLNGVTNPLLRIFYTYDKAGRQTKIEQVAASAAESPTYVYEYDAAGNLLSNTDKFGFSTRYNYDLLSRMTESIDPREGRTSFSHDAIGKTTSLTDANYNTTVFEHDRLDRLTRETNSLNKAQSYTYDALGNLIEKLDRNGRVTEYDYDYLGRVTHERWLDGNSNVSRTLSWSYDVGGQLLTANDRLPNNSLASADYQFLSYNRSGAQDIVTTLAEVTPTVVLSQIFDARGNRTKLGAAVGLADDFLNDYTYDGLNRVTRITQKDVVGGNFVADKRVDLAYNGLDDFTVISRYADLAATDLVATTDYGYDRVGRLTSQLHKKGGTTLASYQWSWDEANRIRTFTNNQHSAESATYNYDATGQLASANRSGIWNDEYYANDFNGNRVSGEFEVGKNNRLTFDGSFYYQYDDEGNLVRRTVAADDSYTTFEWDHRNRLTSVTDFDDQDVQQQKVSYAYDSLNRLVTRSLQVGAASPVTGHFVYDGNQMTLALDAAGDIEHRLLWGPAVDQIFADENDVGDVYWMLTDHQNTVRDVVEYNAITDATSIVNHIAYDSFGSKQIEMNADLDVVPLDYTARYTDEATGLQWNLNRWYDASAARWISEDPIGLAAGDTNVNRYAQNSPLDSIDPLGLKDYKIGKDDPALRRDYGAGAWGVIDVGLSGWIVSQTMRAAKEAFRWLPNARAHLGHFFGNTGDDYTINLAGMIEESASAAVLRDSERDLAKAFVETLPEGKHHITSGSLSIGSNSKIDSSDWYYAVGGYSSWGKGPATVKCLPNGVREYTLEFEYKFFDRYNWDWLSGKSVTIGFITITDTMMAVLHSGGYAKEFDMYGSVKETIRWRSDGRSVVQPPPASGGR